MSDGDIDYSKYSRQELIEGLEFLNRKAYPRNYENLIDALRHFSNRAPGSPNGVAATIPESTQAPNVGATVPLTTEVTSPYAGFWLRFGAMLIDLLAYMPMVLVMLFFEQRYRLAYLYLFVPSLLVEFWFYVYLVARYGGTPGKLALKMRIAMVDGTNVTLKAAFMRQIVQMAIYALTALGWILAAFHMTDSEYLSLGFSGLALSVRLFASSVVTCDSQFDKSVVFERAFNAAVQFKKARDPRLHRRNGRYQAVRGQFCAGLMRKKTIDRDFTIQRD